MEYGVVLVWWLTFLVLGVVGLPLAATLFRDLPDRGASLALPLSILVLGLVVFWVGHLAFGPLAIAAGLLVLVGVSILTAWRSPEMEIGRFVEWGVVFTLGFALLVAVRAVDPSITPAGGEKFLDFGLLQAHLRAASLPPEDMWFAGEPVRYYYGGHMIAATLATITDTAAKYAYNVALAGFYGALVASAYGVAGSIAASRGVPYRKGGALGAFFVGFASNLAPVVGAVIFAVKFVSEGIARSVAEAVANATALHAEWLLGNVGPGGYWAYYWDPSRVIGGTINEFPLFAFLNGDLHAHMMSTPLLVLAVGIGLAYYRTPASEIRRRRSLVLGAFPPVAGLIAVVNTWSFPSIAGIAAVSVLFAPTDPRDLLPLDSLRQEAGIADELGRVAGAGTLALVVGLLGVLWGLPFFVGPATGASGRSIALVENRSNLLAFLIVHGWILGVFAAYLGSRLPGLTDRPDRFLLLVALLLGVGVFFDLAAVAIVLPLVIVAWALLRTESDVGFESVLFVAGGGLVVLVELLYLKEKAGPGRMNTVFKIYMQVWVLWAIAAAGALARIVPSLSEVLSGDRRTRLAAGLAVLLVLSTSIYGVVALGAHFDSTEEATLDATQGIREYFPETWRAIQWLERHATEDTTILSAPGTAPAPGMYSWRSNPASSFTGIPTVAGWGHERGYRGIEAYRARVEAVDTAYTGSPQRVAEILRKYDVEYVWLSPAERSRYTVITITDVPGVERVYGEGLSEVKIYRVHRDELPN